MYFEGCVQRSPLRAGLCDRRSRESGCLPKKTRIKRRSQPPPPLVRRLLSVTWGQALKTETENEIKFNNSYQALYRQLKDVYTKIGATDHFGVVGEKFVYSRHERVNDDNCR